MDIIEYWKCKPKFPERYPDYWKQIKEFLTQENFAKACKVGDEDFARKVWFRFIYDDGSQSLPLVLPQHSIKDFDFQKELRKLSETTDKS